MTQYLTDEAEILQTLIRESLHKEITPHDGQVEILHAIWHRGCKFVFVNCGRNFGKSTIATYIAARIALENPKSRIFYYAPLLKQVKDIVWNPGLLELFIDDHFVEKRDSQDARLWLKNKSFIKLDGSEHWQAARGLKPDVVIADEYAQFHPMWIDAMMPNQLARKALFLFIGTPPEFPILDDGSSHHFVQMLEESKRRAISEPDTVAFFHRDSYSNPHNDPAAIKAEEARYTKRGEEWVFQREYLAKIVHGSKRAVFPPEVFSVEKNVVPHEQILAEISVDPDSWEYLVGADPGNRAVFGVNFFAVNHKAGRFLWVDELHLTEAHETTALCANPLIVEKALDIYPVQAAWRFVADSAALSFITESGHHPVTPIDWEGCKKQAGDKYEYLGLMKDIFIMSGGCISDRCQGFISEVQSYMRDARGLPVKRGDHHIDLSRYIIKSSAFDQIVPKPQPEIKLFKPDGTLNMTMAELREKWREEDDPLDIRNW